MQGELWKDTQVGVGANGEPLYFRGFLELLETKDQCLSQMHKEVANLKGQLKQAEKFKRDMGFGPVPGSERKKFPKYKENAHGDS